MVTDKPGVLNRMASLFRRRGFNIESIAVGHSELPHISRVTIVVDGATTMVDTGEGTIIRELALIKVKTDSANRSEVMQVVDIFRANIVDVAADSVTVEVTGDEQKISSLYKLLSGFGIKEIARTGLIAMTRGGSTSAVRKASQKQSQKKGKGAGRAQNKK
jgi:acetolactate synthase-1/3 small subunit